MKRYVLKLTNAIDNKLADMSVFSRYPICLYALNLQMFLRRFYPTLELPDFPPEVPLGLSSNVPEIQRMIDKNINRK